MSSIILNSALALITLGMAITVVGVMAHAMFYPGVFLIAIGCVAVMVGGVLHIVRRTDPT